jgi:hypothetical protein
MPVSFLTSSIDNYVLVICQLQIQVGFMGTVTAQKPQNPDYPGIFPLPLI